jgi:hypothetical protein
VAELSGFTEAEAEAAAAAGPRRGRSRVPAVSPARKVGADRPRLHPPSHGVRGERRRLG